jgi:hypothetical protein
VLARKMHRLGRISHKVLIFYGIKFHDSNQRRFRRAPLASSTGHDWLHALAGCCPSPVIGKAVFARFVGGATSNGFTQKIVHMLVRSDTLVFSGSQTCGILLFRTRAERSFGEQKVKDSDRLELDWLLKCKLEELIASVRPMSAKNCEQIVRAILDRIGGPSFEQLLMRIVETMVPRDGRGPPTNSDEYYFAIRDLFPHVPPENDVLGRLLCFAMRMCLLRIEKNPNPTAHLTKYFHAIRGSRTR